MAKRYNVNGSRVRADGEREEIMVIPAGARREAIAEIDALNGQIYKPTAADRAAMGQATFIELDDELAEMDELDDELHCPY